MRTCTGDNVSNILAFNAKYMEVLDKPPSWTDMTATQKVCISLYTYKYIYICLYLYNSFVF